MAQTGYNLRKRNLSQSLPGLNKTNALEGQEEGATTSTEEISDLSKENKAKDQEDENQPPSNNPKKKVASEIPLIEMTDFETVNMDDKLNLLMSAINKVNTNFHLKIDSIKVELLGHKTAMEPCIKELEKLNQELTARVDDLEHKCAGYNDLCERTEKIELENAKLKDDVAILKGFVQVQDKAISSNQKKIVDLTARSMANNVIVSGIPETDVNEENCKNLIIKFFEEKLKLELNHDHVEVAHRLGVKQANARYAQAIIARCLPDLKQRVFKATHLLKDVKNAKGDYYSVKPQLPEPLLSEKIEREDRLRSIRKANEQIPDEDKHRKTTAHIKNRVLYVNNIPQ